MRRVPLTLLAAASLTIGLLAVAPQIQAAPARDSSDFVNSCSQQVSVGTMTCFALRRTSKAEARPNAEPSITPGGYGPTDLQSAYELAASINNGVGQTVYIIDAFDDPTLESDLAVYRSQYNLSPCTVANGCLRKLNQTGGTSPLPATNTGWAGEESLDVDMVSASCPNCHITMIEANTNNDVDLMAAINLANNTFGAKIVSMSWGGTAGSEDYAFDQAGNFHSGVAYLVSTGDKSHAAQWPAVSPGVVAVGGTSLTHSASPRGWSETAWFTNNTKGAGSGCDNNEPKPSWQVGQSAVNFCTGRAEADISAVADPNTGVAVYQTFGASGWTIYGGTSASAPLIAGMYGLAGGPSTGERPGQTIWQHAPVGSLNDVTSGGYASCTPKQLCQATTGWDGPTGLGTPNGLGALSSTSTPVNVSTTVTGTQVYGGSPAFAGTTSIPGLTASGMHCTQLTSGSLSPTTPVGTYTIVGSSCSGGTTSDPTHYVPSPYVGSTFVVTPAPLAISPSPLTVALGTSSATASASYSGFVNSEGPAALQALPVCSVAASPADLPAGTYPGWTVCSGASAANYTVTYARGALTVQPGGLSVAVTGTLINHGAALFQGVASQPGIAVSGVTCTTANGGTPLASLPAGTYTLDPSSCSGGTLSNPSYTVQGYTGGQFTVAPFGVSVTTLPAATIGKAYSGKLTAAGGKASYSFALLSGQLPPGMKLSAAGAISGNPTLTGTYAATVTLKDSSAPKQSQTWTFSIAVSPLTISTATLPAPVIGKSYNNKVLASSGKAPITFAVTSGALPTGLKIAAAGGITGVPTGPGTSVVVITATDSSNPKVSTHRTFVVTVDPIAVVTSPALPSGTVGTAYTAHLTSTGGKTPLAWAVIAGSLPTGLKLSAAGAFSGTPKAAGTYSFTVRVTDKSVPANTAVAVVSITVS